METGGVEKGQIFGLENRNLNNHKGEFNSKLNVLLKILKESLIISISLSENCIALLTPRMKIAQQTLGESKRFPKVLISGL